MAADAVSSDCPVSEAAERLLAHSAHSLVVIEGRKPVGVFSGENALRALLKPDAASGPVSRAMSAAYLRVALGEDVRSVDVRAAAYTARLPVVVVEGAPREAVLKSRRIPAAQAQRHAGRRQPAVGAVEVGGLQAQRARRFLESRLDRRIGQHRVIVEIDLPGVVEGAEAVGQALVRIADRVELGVARLLGGFEMGILRDRPATKHAHAQQPLVLPHAASSPAI